MKNLPANYRDTVSILGLERSSGGGNGKPFQYCCLKIPWTKEPGRATVHNATESDRTEQLNTHTSPLLTHACYALDVILLTRL